MLLDCCCMPDVARHEMDKSFESYRCFTVVGRKHIYYQKRMKKVFSYDNANVRLIIRATTKANRKHQACNSNPVA